jgi:hypothetical protein
MEGEKMSLLENHDNIRVLVESLNFRKKVERSLSLIDKAYKQYGEGLVLGFVSSASKPSL